jgi:hypothetical protein
MHKKLNLLVLLVVFPLFGASCGLQAIKPDISTSARSFGDLLYVQQGDLLHGSFAYSLKNRFAIDKVVLNDCTVTIDSNAVDGDSGIVNFSFSTASEEIGRHLYEIKEIDYVDTYTQQRGACTLPIDSKERFPSLLIIKNENYASTILVDGEGSGDYKTVNEALAKAKETPTQRRAILLKEGGYAEMVDLSNDAGIDLYALSPRLVTIYSPWDTEGYPALRFDGEGYFYGVNFMSYDPFNIGHEVGGAALYYNSQNPFGEGTFKDCVLNSTVNSAVNLALSKNSHLNFDGCQFQCSDRTHPTVSINTSWQTGATNQKVAFSDCTFDSEATPLLDIEDKNNLQGDQSNQGGEAVLTFLNNVFTIPSGVTPGYTLLGGDKKNDRCLVGSIELGRESTGNNLTFLNAK